MLLQKRIIIQAFFMFSLFLFTSCTKTETESNNINGQAIFWVSSDFGCGNITVICEGITKQITGYYGSAPSCGASSSANFTLPKGSHSFSASCSNKTWSGNITVTANTCSAFQLNSGSGNTGCSYSLNGTWVRYSGGSPGCDGQRISFDGTTGITNYSPTGCLFSIGDVSWKNFNSTNCTIDGLLDHSGTYKTASINFNSPIEIILDGTIVWKKQ